MSLTQVDYRFANLGSIEVTSEVIRPLSVLPVPTLTAAGLLVLGLSVAAAGLFFLRRQVVRGS